MALSKVMSKLDLNAVPDEQEIESSESGEEKGESPPVTVEAKIESSSSAKDENEAYESSSDEEELDWTPGEVDTQEYHIPNTVAHSFEPIQGRHVVVGTNTGQVFVISIPVLPKDKEMRDRSRRRCEDETRVRNSLEVTEDMKPIVWVHWAPEGVYIADEYLVSISHWNAETERLGKPLAMFPSEARILSVAHLVGSKHKLLVCAEDGVNTVYEVFGREDPFPVKLEKHTDTTSVAAASEQLVAVGGRDGSVHLYDEAMRTAQPTRVLHFDTPITHLAMNKKSTVIAVAGLGYVAPCLKDLANDDPWRSFSTRSWTPVRVMHFDGVGNLYWGGEGGILRKSDGLERITKEFCPSQVVPFIRSIATVLDESGEVKVSVGGDENYIMCSEYGVQEWKTRFKVPEQPRAPNSDRRDEDRHHY